MNKSKVLIVEDEIIVAFNIKMHLRYFDFDILPLVTKGDKAVEMAGTERPDLIIMDIVLSSKMNGIEAAREILSIYKPLIIFTSGYLDKKINQEIKSMNAVMLYKPYKLEDLVAIIKEKLVISM